MVSSLDRGRAALKACRQSRGEMSPSGRPEDRKALDYSNIMLMRSNPCSRLTARRAHPLSGRPGQKGLVPPAQSPRGAGGFDQVRALLRGDRKALVAPPALDLGVVPGQQRLRHVAPGPFLGPGVMGTVEQPVQYRIEAVELVA